MTTGIAPIQGKKANVIPLFKNGDLNSFQNYRPVSLLSVFSKLMEKVVYARCKDFLDQFGYRRNRSTSHALLLLLEKFATAHEHDEVTVGVFLTSQRLSTWLTTIFCLKN